MSEKRQRQQGRRRFAMTSGREKNFRISNFKTSQNFGRVSVVNEKGTSLDPSLDGLRRASTSRKIEPLLSRVGFLKSDLWFVVCGLWSFSFCC